MENCRHEKPSPSQEVGAWCNSGCGQFLPIPRFTPSPARAAGSYYIDGRAIARLLGVKVHSIDNGQVVSEREVYDAIKYLVELVDEM